MQDLQDVRTVEDVRKVVETRAARFVKVGVFDIDGVLRGKYMSREKFLSSLDKGFGFCDVVLGWDSNDQLYDNVSYTGWHTGYPDAPARLIPESCRALPYEDDTLFFLGEFGPPADAICPRGTLRRALDVAADRGFQINAAFEYEFFIFNETVDSVYEKGFRNLKPLTPGNFGYSVLRNSVYAEFYHELLSVLEGMNIPIEGLHTETGPGVLEAAISVCDGLDAADKAALFKTFTKVVAQRNELMATFMAKWSPNYPGQSGHIHISLTDKEGKSLFHDASDSNGMSKTMRHFLGGCQRLMPEVLAMVASTVNSYTRLIPGFWAPTNATWGVDNRTCALRVIPGSASSQRIEYRVAAADANPYLALAAVVVSGLHGVEHEVEPTSGIIGNAYEAKLDLPQFPATLFDAAGALRGCKAAREMLGSEFIDHFASTREWEEREFRKHISDWELRRYFEII